MVRTALYAADGGNVAFFSLNGQVTCPLQTFPMINPGVASVGQGSPCVFVPGTYSLTVGAVYRGGLQATYYNNQLLTVPYSSILDSSWFFKDWGSSAPLGSLSRSDFGVRNKTGSWLFGGHLCVAIRETTPVVTIAPQVRWSGFVRPNMTAWYAPPPDQIDYVFPDQIDCFFVTFSQVHHISSS